MKDIQEIKKEYEELMYESGLSGVIDTKFINLSWNFISNLIQKEREEAKKEEAERWINQPANEHDNRIREEAVAGFIKELTEKLNADLVTPLEIDGLSNRYYRETQILDLIYNINNDLIENLSQTKGGKE
jgi:hypothetical protein